MKFIYIFFTILIFNSFIGYSQTKLETEYWINSKFVTHKLQTEFKTSDFQKTLIIYDYISFEDCKMTLGKTSYSNGPGFEQTYEINIGDIKSIVWNKNTLIFTSKNYNINWKGRIIGESRFNHINFVNTLSFEINGNAESNLKERILKAFNYLKTFCKPSIIEKEPF